MGTNKIRQKDNTIKFNAWNRVHENMFPVARIDFADGSVYPTIFGPGQLLEDCVLLQYTGELDDDGIEMYVGDIIKVKGAYIDTPMGSGYQYETIDVIESLDYFYTQIMKNVQHFKVIGNIYQNKDLAKQRYR